MIQNVLSRIGGVGMYEVISICLFFAVFVGIHHAENLMKTKPLLRTLAAVAGLVATFQNASGQSWTLTNAPNILHPSSNSILKGLAHSAQQPC